MRGAARIAKVARGRPKGKFTQTLRLNRLRETLESNPSGMSLEDLAMVLRVTTRSVRRYLAWLGEFTELESIETARGGPHLWRIKPSERGRAVALRKTQAYGLLAARRVFDVLRGSALYDEIDFAVRQLAQIAQRPTSRPGRSADGDVPASSRLEDRFVYVPSPAWSYANRAEELDDLFRAVAELHVIRFRFAEGGRNETSGRVTAHPYAMALHRGAVHCVALDTGKRVVRPFPFHRMDDLRVEPERFLLPDDFDLSRYVHGELGLGRGDVKVPVLIEFEPRAGADVRARRVHATQKIATASDGRVRLSMTVSDLADVKEWVLRFGASARVIEPKELALEVTKELRRALARYGPAWEKP